MCLVLAVVRWMPLTFDLECDYAQFLEEFKRRADAGDDNLWISALFYLRFVCTHAEILFLCVFLPVKPWKLARGLEITISDSLKCITRLMDASPMIASKCTLRLTSQFFECLA